ncbi:MAG: DUF202 domain-containing protein [Cellulomonadaceae bacterium]
MSTDAGPQGAGLQPERTSLAWRRVALALLVLAAAAPQVTWPVLGAWSLAPSAAVAGGALWLFHAERRRYQRMPEPDGRLVLAVAAGAAVLALVAAAAVTVSILD